MIRSALYTFMHAGLLMLTCMQSRGSADSTAETAARVRKEAIIEIGREVRAARQISLTNSDSAIPMLRHAIRESIRLGDHNFAIEGLISLGAAYTDKGVYGPAAEAFRRALVYSPQADNPVVAACRALNNLGNTYMYRGLYGEAMQHYVYAAQLAEKKAHRDTLTADHLIRIYNNTGSLLQQSGQYEKALRYFGQAEQQALRIKATARLPSIYANKALVYVRAGNREKAWEYNMQAYSLAVQLQFIQKQLTRQVQFNQTQFIALKGMADILLAERKPEKAIPYLEKALRIKENINPYYTVTALQSLGSAYLSLRNYALAESHLQSARQKAEAAQVTDGILNIHRELSSLYEHTGNYHKAFAHQRIYFYLKDSILNKEKTEAVNLLEVKYRTAQKEKEITEKQLLINRQIRTLRQKNAWILGIAGGSVLLALLLLSYYRTIRHKQKINILSAMISGEERERKRIGQELHDGIGGRLAAIHMNFGAVQKRYGSFAGTTELEQIMKMMYDTTEEVRKTAHNLIPDILSRYSFPEALRMYCEQISTPALRVLIQVPDDLSLIPDKNIELMIYRIIQELVQNIVKHSGASQAVVELSELDKELNIIVEDNGCGFDIRQPHTGIGLHNIRSRVKMLQGTITIESANSIGTSIFIHLDAQKLKAALTAEP